MRGAIITALGLFIFLWVMVVNHPKETQAKPYGETYIKSITEYNNRRYEAYNGPETTIEIAAEIASTSKYTPAEETHLRRMGMSEGGTLSIDALQGIYQVAMNREKHESYPDNIIDVINQPNQFSTADNGEPNEKCYIALENAIMYPEAFPTDMLWFNSDHWPAYGYPYTVIDGMYFSTVTNYNEEVE